MEYLYDSIVIFYNDIKFNNIVVERGRNDINLISILIIGFGKVCLIDDVRVTL